MLFIKVLLSIIVLVAALPAGLILSKMCDDEIVKRRNLYGRIKFIALFVAVFLIFLPIAFEIKARFILSLLFISGVMAVMEFKGREKAKKKNK